MFFPTQDAYATDMFRFLSKEHEIAQETYKVCTHPIAVVCIIVLVHFTAVARATASMAQTVSKDT